jgi:phosphatidylinositol glycan class B
METSICYSRYRYIFLSGLLVYLVTAYFSIGYNHPDEHFQILEFCNYKLGLSSASDLPWEFNERIRPALQPTLALLFIKFVKWFDCNSPFTQALLIRLITALLSWFVVCKLSLQLLKEFITDTGKIIFLCLNFFLWFVPFLSVRYSSENYSSITFLAAVFFILINRNREQINYKQIAIAGFLLGLSFFFRFQIAFALIGLFLWLVFIQRMSWKYFLVLFSSALIASLICLYIDYWFYGELVLTPFNYYYSNIIEHKAAGFGISPWYSYFPWFIIQCVPPLSIFLILYFGIGISRKTKDIFVFAFIPFLLGHLIVDHKELRFLFPMIFCFNYLAAIGIDYYISIEKFIKYRKLIYSLSLIVNTPLLVFRLFMPAQEAVSYYKFLYEFKGDNKTIVLSQTSNPYKLLSNFANFYKSSSIEYIVYSDKEELSKILEEKRPKEVLMFKREIEPNLQIDSYHIEESYCIYPDWLLKYNFNDWQSRTKIWMILKLKRNE